MSSADALERLRRLAAYYKDVLTSQIQSAARHYFDLGVVVGRGLVADLSPFLSSLDEVITRSELCLRIEPASSEAIETVLDAAEQAENSGGECRGDETEAILTRRQMSARLTAIYRKQQQDPFNRETILGLPIVAGRYGAKRFCGPLFYFRVQVDHDPIKSEICITRLNEEPLLNMSLLSILVGDEAEGDLVRQKLLPLVLEDAFDSAFIQKAARMVAELVRGLRGLRRQGADLAPLEACLLARSQEEPAYFHSCVLINAPRSHAFLQDDLSALSKLDVLADGTALELLLEDTEERLPDLEDPIKIPDAELLYFPLLSNPAQRRAAAKAERARLLTIQGPPGTGKSQTIANLVCHLVARGHSVLVTSHQNKALEVVADKLPQIDYLAMSLLKGDKESVEALRTQLDQYETMTAGLGLADLAEAVRRSIRKLEELKRRICSYHARFAELKELERKQESSYRRYDELREFDGIHPSDTPGDDLAAAEARLKQWRTHLEGMCRAFPLLYRFYAVDGGTSSSEEILKLQPVSRDLLSLAEAAMVNMKDRSTNRGQIDTYVALTFPVVRKTGENHISAAHTVAQTLATACSVMTALQEALSSPLWSDWGALAEKADPTGEPGLGPVKEIVDWLEASAPELEESLEIIHGSISLGVARRLSEAVDRTVVSELAAQLATAMEDCRSCVIPMDLALPTDARTVQKVGQVLQVLEDGRRSWLRWQLMPSCRAGRRVLGELGYPILSFGLATQELALLRTWENYWRLRHRVVTLCRHLEQMGLPVQVPATEEPLPTLHGIVKGNIALVKVVLLAGKWPGWSGPGVLKEVVGDRLAGLHRPEQVRETLAGLRLLYSVLQSRAEVQRWAGGPTEFLTAGQLAPICRAATELKLTAAAQETWNWARTLLTSEPNPLPAPVARHMEYQDKLLRLRTAHPWPSHQGLWLDPVARIVEGADEQHDVSKLDELRLALEYTPQFAEYLAFAAQNLKGFEESRRSVEASVAQHGRLPDWLAEPGKALEAHRLRKLLVDDLCSCPDDLNAVARAASKVQEEYRHEVIRLVQHSRRLAIKEAQNDPKTHRTISKLKTLLGRRRKTPSLLMLRDQIDYSLLLKVFPCWLMNIEDVARVFPLVPGLFDYVIVDEASQCQQATALHLAYRGQRLLVVGDRQQLQSPSTRFLSAKMVQLLLARHHLEAEAFKFDARRSFLDLAEYCSQGKEFLNEHFRCEPAIIAWSNQEFYDRQLVVVTPLRSPRFNPCLEWRLVRGADDEPEKKVNDAEAQAVAREVRKLVESGEADGLSVGVISPFREQANRIHSLIYETLADHPDWIKRHEIVSATADGFQGDERDIILYSFRYGASTSPGTVTAIELERERLNVAFTRARRRAICFTSVAPDRFPQGLIRGFLEHAIASQRNGTDCLTYEDRFDSEFERRVCQRLRSLSYSVSTQVPCGPFRIDLVVRDGEGRRLAVECDGEFHYDEDGYLRPEDYQRQDLLERAGWTVHRLSCRRFYWDPDSAVAELLEVLREQETESERALVQQSWGEEADLVRAPEGKTEGGRQLPQAEVFAGREAREIVSGGAGQPTCREDALPPNIPEMLRPDSWFLLSHWSKSTGLFSPYNNQFCYGFGMLLARKRTPTSKQAKHARSLWEVAVRRGFCPGAVRSSGDAKDHAQEHLPDSTSQGPGQMSLPVRQNEEPKATEAVSPRELRVFVCDLGRIHVRITCPALVNQDSAPNEMSLREALMGGNVWCSWCLRHSSVEKVG